MTHRVVIIKPPRKAMGVRARFEAWHKRNFGIQRLGRFGSRYRDWLTQREWECYRAGFAAGRKECP